MTPTGRLGGSDRALAIVQCAGRFSLCPVIFLTQARECAHCENGRSDLPYTKRSGDMVYTSWLD